MPLPNTETSFIDTDDLRIAYESRGPAAGKPALLLHGWPDDVRAWDRVAASLAARGYRVIVPHLRGFGRTTFHNAAAPRTAGPTVLALDAIHLLDQIGLQKVTLVGHDWCGRTGYVLSALWPERFEKFVCCSVQYSMKMIPGDQLNYRQGHAYWYQWFMGSERGREALQKNRREYCHYLWTTWAPTWKFTPDEFATTAASWDNPDWVDITLHSYRVRWGSAPEDPRYAELDARIEQEPKITVPTTLLHGELDGASLAESTEGQERKFAGPYRRKVLTGCGHFLPREAPAAIVEAVIGE